MSHNPGLAQVPAPGRCFVVVRTRYHRPGTAFIVAECVDSGVGFDSSYSDSGIYTREQMEADPTLAAALNSWLTGDDAVFSKEDAAFEREFLQERTTLAQAMAAPGDEAPAARGERHLRLVPQPAV